MHESGMQLFKCCAVLSFAKLTAKLLRLKLALDLQTRISEATEHFKLITTSWRIVCEKLIRNEVTNNSSTVCHCYATPKRLQGETTAEVRIEPLVTSQK